MRGIAAFSVLLHHSALAFPVIYDDTRADGLTTVNALKYTPLHAFFAGNPAVIVFFVLSGLVLAIPFVEGRGNGYRAFIVKRVCRLWPPYAVAVAAAFLLAATIGGSGLSGMSGWFNEKWQDPITAASIAEHASLVASFDNNVFNPVIWSLVHEMRVSLVFPALVLATVLLGWKRGLTLALLISCIGVLARSGIGGGDYWGTLKYLPCFVVGILLAVHRKALGALIERLSSRMTAALAAAALLAYSWPFWVNSDWFPGPLARAVHTPVTDLVAILLGATVLILLAQRPGRAQSALLSRVPQFLGRISYSLYLLHVVVLLTVLHVFGGVVQPVLLLPIVWVVAIVLADVMQRVVERPSQNLGRHLAAHRAIASPTAVPAPAESSQAIPLAEGR
ncbi:MAG: acyltransferase [Actinomycetota bacterium]|nr:acyltransferase [Actinomycetota bacterium]